MKKVEAAYLAGLIDGEGCIFVQRAVIGLQKKNVKNKKYVEKFHHNLIKKEFKNGFNNLS